MHRVTMPSQVHMHDFTPFFITDFGSGDFTLIYHLAYAILPPGFWVLNVLATNCLQSALSIVDISHLPAREGDYKGLQLLHRAAVECIRVSLAR